VDNEGSFWLFGGTGRDNGKENNANRYNSINIGTGGGVLKDLWRYKDVNWTWISKQEYMELREFQTLTIFPAQELMQLVGRITLEICGCMADMLKLFLVIQFIQTVPPTYHIGVYNDLWKFDGNYWTWMSGILNDIVGNHGELGIPNESNMPSPRQGALGWTDLNGNLWIFGGVGKTEYFSDMNIV
jgi:hypothetical protein